ncbi:hypothetical protein [Lapidilactobacillus gannanensis]|uniref:Uncharacterized protein n=1 Tax=Lapidilactobacillus gannanensis TaxID=2486002 RepID=A0ABW4BMM5_9LACO|nr:hypothetical protein [Lapidilactobacillus gannanensis]
MTDKNEFNEPVKVSFPGLLTRLENTYNFNKENVCPNKLEDIVADIKKIETKYNLRPRQLESVMKFTRVESELVQLLDRR